MPIGILDTNTVSDLMGDDPKVKARGAAHADPLRTSAIVAGEIRFGRDRLPIGRKRSDLEARAQTTLANLQIEPVGELIAQTYGRLKSDLERRASFWAATT